MCVKKGSVCLKERFLWICVEGGWVVRSACPVSLCSGKGGCCRAQKRQRSDCAFLNVCVFVCCVREEKKKIEEEKKKAEEDKTKAEQEKDAAKKEVRQAQTDTQAQTWRRHTKSISTNMSTLFLFAIFSGSKLKFEYLFVCVAPPSAGGQVERGVVQGQGGGGAQEVARQDQQGAAGRAHQDHGTHDRAGG